MAHAWWEALLEFFTVTFKIIHLCCEAIVKFFLPRKLLRKDVEGQRVLITGAGSGLGKMMAYRFMELGCQVVLWDINTEAIESMAEEMGSQICCKAYTVDLSSREQVYKAADRVKEELGTVDILVNNAGIVTGQKFLNCPDSLIEKTMAININAHFWQSWSDLIREVGTIADPLKDSLYTVKAFLPAMIARDKGHIVSIASSAGLFGTTGLVDYCASKFAAVGFHESLLIELEALGTKGVHSTIVCPYFINTGMFEGVKTRSPNLLPILQADKTVDRIMDAILCNQTLLILPRFLYLGYALKGLVPVNVECLLNKYLGVSNCMDTFVGQTKAQ